MLSEGRPRRTLRCGSVNDEEADGNDFGLSSITEDNVKVNVATGGNLFSRKAINWFIIWDHGGIWELKFLIRCLVKDVDGAALVDEACVVREGDGRHAASVMGMSNVVDGLDMAEVFLFSRRGGSSTSETTGDGVDSAGKGGSVGVTAVRASWGSWLVGWLGRLSWRESWGGRLLSERGGWRDREG